jgi:salicylate hydroxylase
MPITQENPLHVIVVGAGLGGLAAAIAIRQSGHDVTICEQAPALGEVCIQPSSLPSSTDRGINQVGAGIQIPPNSARVLERFGVLDEIRRLSVLPHAFVMRSYKGPELNRQPMLPYCEETYGAPYLHIHRADFHTVLVNRATELGAKSLSLLPRPAS